MEPFVRHPIHAHALQGTEGTNVVIFIVAESLVQIPACATRGEPVQARTIVTASPDGVLKPIPPLAAKRLATHSMMTT